MNENDVEISQLHQTKVYLMWEDVIRICNNAVAGENKQLKELLKKCLEELKMVQGETKDFANSVDECIAKINQVLGENK